LDSLLLLIASTVSTGLLLGAIFALVAAGVTIVYGCIWLPNASNGQFFLLSALVAWGLTSSYGINSFTACLIVYLGIIMAKQAWNSTYTTLPFSQATIYVVTSISASIMVLFSLEELIDRLREKTGQEA